MEGDKNSTLSWSKYITSTNQHLLLLLMRWWIAILSYSVVSVHRDFSPYWYCRATFASIVSRQYEFSGEMMGYAPLVEWSEVPP